MGTQRLIDRLPAEAFMVVGGLLVALAVVALVLSWVGGGLAEGNVNALRGNSAGQDRHADFMRVVEHAKELTVGDHSPSELPPPLQLKNMIAVHVESRTVVALEFPSRPIDSDPVYIFVDPSEPDPERAARAACDKHGWRLAKRLDEAGWYYAYGP